jgi:hypothetical protein
VVANHDSGKPPTGCPANIPQGRGDSLILKIVTGTHCGHSIDTFMGAS